MSDDENQCLQTSDYFSESTPNSCKSIRLDHKYALSPPAHSATTSSGQSSMASRTPIQSNRKLFKNQKLLKRRKLFDIDCQKSRSAPLIVTPLSERQQLAIALQLSSNSAECDTNQALSEANDELRSGVQKVRRNHKGETGLHIAAIKGDLNRVQQIIADHTYDIDCTDFAGWAPIHEASNRGYVSIVEALLKAGSNVNARGYNQTTPLIDAAVNGHHLLVDLLLRHGADYSLRNSNNKSALEVAKTVGVVEVIQTFINEKMRKNGANNKDITKSRPSSPSNTPSPLKPTSPRLTLRFQTIKDNKQTVTTTTTTSSSAMSSTKTYSVSTALDKEVSNELNSTNDKQNDTNKQTTPSNGSAPDVVSASSSDHNYTSVDSSMTTTTDESTRGRKRRKSNDGSVGSVSSTSTTSSGPSPRIGSTCSVASWAQSGGSHNKKHHHQHPHHHVNHSNKSSASSKEKSVKKLFSSSSDSDGIEGSECDRELNLKDNTSNSNSSNNSSEAMAPKVPPLRIVLPANTVNTTAASSASTASNNSVAASVTSSTSSSAAKFPYVVSSEESFQSESECASGAVGSQRITRSSQRVAQQQSQKSAPNEHQSEEDEAQTDAQHPRKRKIRSNNANEKSATNANNNHNSVQTANGENDNDSTSSTSSLNGLAAKDVSPFALPQSNCYQMFLSIRKNIDKKRKEMFFVQPKAPQGFDDYLLNRCSYILEGQSSSATSKGATAQAKPTLTPPPNTLPGPRMHDVFTEHEKHRYKLKIQHLIERQKLVLSAEQEILRVHGRAARAMANQSVPFSVCSILKDEEIYNIIDSESEQNESSSNQLKSDKPLSASTSGLSANRTRYNGRLFISWLQDVVDKWEKTKEVLLLRHRKESESLLAMQRLEWEWKLKEFALCDLKTSPTIDDSHVPKVIVGDDFDLFPV